MRHLRVCDIKSDSLHWITMSHPDVPGEAKLVLIDDEQVHFEVVFNIAEWETLNACMMDSLTKHDRPLS